MRSSPPNSTSDARQEAAIRKLQNVLLFAGLCYAFVVAAMFFAQRSILYPGATGGPAGPARWGEAVTIPTPDGERLHAVYSPAADGAPTVLFFHGNADRIDHYDFLASGLSRRGIGLLALSYRGYPGSTGRPGEDGLIIDGLAAYDWIAARADGVIVPLGQSLGSGVAVAVAAERPAAGVALISAYDSIAAVAQGVYFFLPVSPLIRDPFRSDRRITGITVPKFFIHGRRDNIIPLARGEALFAAASEPKEMIVLDAYGHNDIWTPDLVERIARFVEEIAF